jgi:hypothetical protein
MRRRKDRANEAIYASFARVYISSSTPKCAGVVRGSTFENPRAPVVNMRRRFAAMGVLAAIAMLLALCAMPAAAEAPTSAVPRGAGTGVKDQVWENIVRLLPNPLKVRGVDTSAGTEGAHAGCCGSDSHCGPVFLFLSPIKRRRADPVVLARRCCSGWLLRLAPSW